MKIGQIPVKGANHALFSAGLVAIALLTLVVVSFAAPVQESFGTGEIKGKRVAILVADGFEQTELFEPKEALDTAGAKTSIVSPADGNVKSWNEKDCEAVRTFRPLSDQKIEERLAKTDAAGAHGDFEPFKISSIFDSTAAHPEWLGDEPPRIRDLLRS